MKILVNDVPDLLEAEADSTLGRLLAEVQDWARNQGLVITSFELDGEVLTLERQRDLAAAGLDGWGELHVSTCLPERLAADTLQGLDDMLDRLERNHRAAGEEIQRGRREEGLRGLADGIEGWQLLQHTLGQILALLGLDPGATEAAGEPLARRIARLSGVLRDTDEAVTSSDYVALGDLLEYELAPMVTDWRAVVRDLIARVEQRLDAPAAGPTDPN